MYNNLNDLGGRSFRTVGNGLEDMRAMDCGNDAIPGKMNLGNEVIYIGSGLVLVFVHSAPV